MPLPSREEQLATAIRYLQRDGLVIVKDRPGHVADDVVRWAEDRGLRVERRRRTLGRATHWEIRRVDQSVGEPGRQYTEGGRCSVG